MAWLRGLWMQGGGYLWVESSGSTHRANAEELLRQWRFIDAGNPFARWDGYVYVLDAVDVVLTRGARLPGGNWQCNPVLTVLPPVRPTEEDPEEEDKAPTLSIGDYRCDGIGQPILSDYNTALYRVDPAAGSLDYPTTRDKAPYIVSEDLHSRTWGLDVYSRGTGEDGEDEFLETIKAAAVDDTTAPGLFPVTLEEHFGGGIKSWTVRVGAITGITGCGYEVKTGSADIGLGNGVTVWNGEGYAGYIPDEGFEIGGLSPGYGGMNCLAVRFVKPFRDAAIKMPSTDPLHQTQLYPAKFGPWRVVGACWPLTETVADLCGNCNAPPEGENPGYQFQQPPVIIIFLLLALIAAMRIMVEILEAFIFSAALDLAFAAVAESVQALYAFVYGRYGRAGTDILQLIDKAYGAASAGAKHAKQIPLTPAEQQAALNAEILESSEALRQYEAETNLLIQRLGGGE